MNRRRIQITSEKVIPFSVAQRVEKYIVKNNGVYKNGVFTSFYFEPLMNGMCRVKFEYSR